MRGLVEALETERTPGPDDSAVVTIVERIIGQRSRHPRFVDQGPEDFESFPTVVHYAEGDLVDAARAVVAPESFSTEVRMNSSDGEG